MKGSMILTCVYFCPFFADSAIESILYCNSFLVSFCWRYNICDFDMEGRIVVGLINSFPFEFVRQQWLYCLWYWYKLKIGTVLHPRGGVCAITFCTTITTNAYSINWLYLFIHPLYQPLLNCVFWSRQVLKIGTRTSNLVLNVGGIVTPFCLYSINAPLGVHHSTQIKRYLHNNRTELFAKLTFHKLLHTPLPRHKILLYKSRMAWWAGVIIYTGAPRSARRVKIVAQINSLWWSK